MFKTPTPITMQMTTMVPIYKPYNENYGHHHIYNQIFSPLSPAQANDLKDDFNRLNATETEASKHANGMVQLTSPATSNIKNLIQDMNYAQDMLRMTVVEDGYHVGCFANVPNADPSYIKPHRDHTPLMRYLQQQGSDGHNGLTDLMLHATAHVTLSTPDLRQAEQLFKVATIIQPALGHMLDCRCYFMSAERAESAYNDSFDNTGRPLQRVGLFTNILTSDNPIVTFQHYKDDLKDSYSLGANTKLSELRKVKKPGKATMDLTPQINLFMPDVDAGYNTLTDQYDVTVKLDYNTQPAFTLALLHSLLGTNNNVNGTMRILDDLGLSLNSDAVADTAKRVQTAHITGQDYGSVATSDVMVALFTNNNHDTCLTNSMRNRVLEVDYEHPAFSVTQDNKELYENEKSFNSDCLTRYTPF